MIRLTVVTLAALYAVLYYVGDDARRPAEVSRAETPALGVTAASFSTDLSDTAATPLDTSRVSEDEAIRLALAAGAAHRAERGRKPLAGAVIRASATSDTPVETPEAGTERATDAPLWYVTGERVNLRRGPGTSNPVIGQVALGDAAEVLDDRDGWYQIQLSDGSVTGWIFGRFLDQNQPG